MWIFSRTHCMLWIKGDLLQLLFSQIIVNECIFLELARQNEYHDHLMHWTGLVLAAEYAIDYLKLMPNFICTYRIAASSSLHCVGSKQTWRTVDSVLSFDWLSWRSFWEVWDRLMVTVHGDGGRQESVSALLLNDPLWYTIILLDSQTPATHVQHTPIFFADSHCSREWSVYNLNDLPSM